MNTHFYFLEGVTASNFGTIAPALSKIAGAKPIQTEGHSKVSVFVVLNPESHAEVTAQVVAVTSGTGVHILQTNFIEATAGL